MLNFQPKLRHWEYILLKVTQESSDLIEVFFGHLSGEFGHRSHNSRNSTWQALSKEAVQKLQFWILEALEMATISE